MPARTYMPRVCHICGADYLPKSGNQKMCRDCRIELAATGGYGSLKAKPLSISDQIRIASKIAQERIKSGLNYVEDINDISWAQ